MVEVATLDGTRAKLDASQIAAFKAGLRGELLLACDHGYDAARRVWNGNVDRRPAIIARCAGVSVSAWRIYRLTIEIFCLNTTPRMKKKGQIFVTAKGWPGSLAKPSGRFKNRSVS